MSSAGYEAGEPEPESIRPGPVLAVIDGGASGACRPTPHSRNLLTTSALTAGLAGISVVTIVPALVLGVLGLRRAAGTGRGALRSWLGIGSALAWAVLAVYLAPHLARAADPGCAAYKGPGLTAYDRVVADFSAAGPRTGLAHDLAVSVSRFRAAAADSADPAAARALAGLTADLRTVTSDVQARMSVPAAQLRALNSDAARADRACGTIGL